MHLRTVLSTFLSMGLELPLNIGSVAFLVLYVHMGLVPVYWAQAAVSCFEMVLVLVIFARSDWERYAKDAKQRQEVEELEAKSAGRLSPLLLSSPASPMVHLYKSPVRTKVAMSTELAAAVPFAEGAEEVTMRVEEF
uniref:Uncharacterized protein n=1 Tax=Zooxanthella nutricula TaxID=1333877 RepID=A0A7S2QAM7_9DINO|mmetsp:Transcript_83672/g.255683  ORF Transcript_83672/g.255683 Transcript_83672/m.255683 type:complete len:137 (+) Transcript_83672:261-671(+)